jgi:hypothetical protein
MKMKKYLLGLAIVLTVTIQAQVPSYVPTSGLVGWWPFTGNANDLSGNSNNGTVNGATLSADRFGSANCAYHFNGNGEHIEVLNDSSLNFEANNVFTLSYWLNADIVDSSLVEFVILKQTGIGTTQDGWNAIIQQNTSEPSFRVMNGTGSSFCYPQSGTPIQPLTDYHIVCVYDNGTADIYINQQLTITTSCSALVGDNSASLFFGLPSSLASFNNRSIKGIIDDIGIWNRALTQHEITTLFNGSGCTFYDTITTHISVYDTTHVTVYDTITTHQTVFDTVTTYLSVNDTLKIDVNLTGIAPPNNTNQVTVYPNPAKDHLLVNLGNYISMNGYTVKITNALGQIVFNQPVNQQQFNIDLSTWGGAGNYILYILDSNQTIKSQKQIVLQ